MISSEARELVLWVENTERLYNQMMYVFRLLARKRDKGIYDAKKAPLAFRALLEAAAKHYMRENGARGEKWFVTFPVIVRREAAQELVETYESWYGVDYQAEKNKGSQTTQ
jgi:hypothetical protein